MSVSLYYTARRSQPITSQEQIACKKIAERYITQYPFGELYEGFCMYDLDKFSDESRENIILNGSTKLPLDVDEGLFLDIVKWWSKCLQEITDTLPGSQWDVHIDDVVVDWREDVHKLT